MFLCSKNYSAFSNRITGKKLFLSENPTAIGRLKDSFKDTKNTPRP